MIQIFKSLPVVVLLGLLSGCAGMSGQFGCHKAAKNRCTPVSQVNAQAESGYFDYQSSGGGVDSSAVLSGKSRHKQKEQKKQNKRTKKNKPLPSPHWSAASSLHAPNRLSERVQRIWIAPYQDAEHNYHGPSDIYTVLKKPRWASVSSNALHTSVSG